MNVSRLSGNDDAPVLGLCDVIAQSLGYRIEGSVPSARPWTNSRPVSCFCLSALTVPYVLPAIGFDIRFILRELRTNQMPGLALALPKNCFLIQGHPDLRGYTTRDQGSRRKPFAVRALR